MREKWLRCITISNSEQQLLKLMTIAAEPNHENKTATALESHCARKIPAPPIYSWKQLSDDDDVGRLSISSMGSS
jgi:hypothetical protein